MSDMGEIFRDMRDADKKRRAENLANALNHKDRFRICSAYHWQYELQDDLLDYYPTKNKWRWRNKNYHGDVIGFISNREKPNDH